MYKEALQLVAVDCPSPTAVCLLGSRNTASCNFTALSFHVLPLFARRRLCVQLGALSGGSDLDTAFGISHERACGRSLRGDRVAARWDTYCCVMRCLFQLTTLCF